MRRAFIGGFHLMVEVLKTPNSPSDRQICCRAVLLDCQFSLDLERSRVGTHFPCRHTVLQVEGITINAGRIMATVNRLGFRCEVLANKICN